MGDSQIYSELTPIFQEVFDDDDVLPKPEMTAKDVSNWDSLNHIRLIVAIEGHFNITFTSAEVNLFTNVGDLVEAINAKLKV